MSFPPDSSLVDEIRPSPNHEPRKGVTRPDILLLHYTGMNTTQAALERLCDPGPRVSSHYLVFEDGRVFQLVPEARRAYHAGESSWEGTTDINSRSIGIEIGNQGHDFGSPAFPEAQIERVIALCRDIVARWSIAPWRVLAHSDVAPSRKRDPGEAFPWRRLAEARVGVWIEPAPIEQGPALSPNDCGAEVAKLQRMLADYGYGVPTDGSYDTITHEVVAAFQRHFRPARVDGMADVSTIKTLEKLLARRMG
ncbi:MAG TPA: N-acetylmuramoyl-L-alanine amidase [Xanthobacteraceae bacterium]|jgi:N-acetylmuramoyl-L-alanine amidase